MAISLTIRGPDGQERRVEFGGGKVTVGSDPRCDVAITDPGVSAEQCVIVERDDGVELFDIGESGGVLLNGTPVQHAQVGPADEIWVGGTIMHLVANGGSGVSFTEADSTVREEMPTPTTPARQAPVAEAQDQRFALLNQVQRLISSIGNENIFESILDTIFDTVAVRRGFIAICDAHGELAVRAHRSRERGSMASEKIEVSRTLVGKVLESGKAVLTSDAEADPDFSAARSIHRLRIKAAICVPLTVEGKVIGLVYGDNREKPGALTRDHLSILSALASVAAVSVEKFRLRGEYEAKLKIEQALAIARSIQLNFLPAEPPRLEGLEVWGKSDSCDETGGDYYDFLPLRDRGLRVVIADVTGHGVGPALLMATVRAALRALHTEPSPSKLMSRLNEFIRDDVRDGRFITAFMADIDPREGTLTHVGAGHTPPIWCRARDGSTQLVASHGPPLGILGGLEFKPGTTLPIASGDALLFTTDGIIEAVNEAGEQFGLTRLRSVVAEHAGGTAQALGEAVCSAVDDFVQGRPLRDDATLVAVKVR
ncbi:MAG: SpoIIE family protein phosphatase [Planctomycetota bacterium]